jgi:hypothetical protein
MTHTGKVPTMSGMNHEFTIQGMLKGMTPLQIGAQGPSDAVTEIHLTTAPDATVKKRCGCCSKKLMLSDIGCSKCESRFCSAHRLPELHACPYDFKKEGQALLAKQNPRVIGEKMERC